MNTANRKPDGLGITSVVSGGGVSLVQTGTAPTAVIKGLNAGTNITLDSTNPSFITINAVAADVDLVSTGGTSLVVDGVGPDLSIKGLQAGTGVTLDTVTNPNAIIINTTSSDVTLASAGGVSQVSDGTGPALAIKGLQAGTGVTLDLATNPNTTIINTTSTDVVLTSTGGTSLVVDGAGPTLSVKGLQAGSNVTLDTVTNPNAIIINAPNTDVTLASAGGTTLVTDGTGPSLAVRGLVAGNGISITSTGTTLVIASSFDPLIFTGLNTAMTSAMVLSTTTQVKIPWQFANGSNVGTWSDVTSTFTAPYTAARYLFTCILTFAADALAPNSTILAQLFRPGGLGVVDNVTIFAPAATAFTYSFSRVVPMNIGEQMEFRIGTNTAARTMTISGTRWQISVLTIT